MEKKRFMEWVIVAVMTPSGSFSQLTKVRRLKKRKPVPEIVKDRGVLIFDYDDPATLESFPKINPLKALN